MPQLLRLMIFLICCSAFSLGVSAQSRWKLAAVDANGKAYFTDENLSRQPGGNILGWERGDLPINRVYPVGSYFVARKEWNCGNNTTRQLQLFIYNRSGDFIERLDVNADWKENPPDSIGEIILKSVCDVFKKKKDNSSRRSSAANSFAQIIVRKADLRSEADPNSEIIREVALSEKLVLISEESVGIWYRVLDGKTNAQGWLDGNDFKIVKAVRAAKKGRKIRRK